MSPVGKTPWKASITGVKLIYSLHLCVKTIHGKFSIADTLFSIVELMTHMDSFLVRHPFEPFNRHLYRALRFEVVFRQVSRVTSRRHVLHNSPEVQSIHIVTHDLLAQLSSLAFFSFPEFRFIGFVVTMEDD